MDITLKMIAHKAGVSAMHVSRALNNKPGVKKDLREKILKIARQQHYQPHIIARSLVLQKTHTIGLIIPCVTHSFFPEITRSVEDVAHSRGYNVLLCHSDDNAQREEEEIRLLLSRKVDGLAIVPATDKINLTVYEQLMKKRVPFCFIDRFYKRLKTSCVITDDKKGAEEAVSYLLSLGHRYIGHIAGPLYLSTAWERYKGYSNALLKNGIKTKTELIRGKKSYEEDGGYQAMKEFLEMKRIPSAIFAANDLLAIGAMKAIKEEGLKIPRDISLVGFADIRMASLLAVPLTTVRQPAREMGRLAAELLIDEIEKKRKQLTQIRLPVRLIIRDSTAPPKK